MSLPEFIKQGVNYPKHFVKGRVQKAENSLEQLQPGEGGIVEMEGKKVAAYRTPEGKVVLLSPVCTHLGCIVGWNQADKTWDCPCHGSRFAADGTVKQGPAKKNLPPAQV